MAYHMSDFMTNHRLAVQVVGYMVDSVADHIADRVADHIADRMAAT